MATGKHPSLRGINKIAISPEMRKLLLGVWHDRLTPHAIVLTYLAARNFGVIRFPTRPDRSVDGGNKGHQDAVDLLDKYTDDELANLSAELNHITSQSQQILSALYKSPSICLERAIAPIDARSQYLTANRAVDNIELYPALALAAERAGLASISMDVDIVSGWSTTATQRYGTLHLSRAWAIDDVLLVSDLLDGPMESNEWLCVNRNPRGLMEFPISSIVLVGVPSNISDRIANSQVVSRLANELQEQANRASSERTLALRPTELWWRSDYKLPPQNILDRLREWAAGIIKK
ncbi:hypothetical protein [Noviherbaspirillum galbum]|uniref:Uncharacterized protein n=1 Tax=Noviherbaspirillum galbum TaxID=2709383 RepID=A0A6B3SN74_9BURK|nr:hypothetical protein [Noviherbaspirillum galbum]NEX60206.1 hypothetical protein [Noviherbaspirillum galbum]